MDLLSSYCVKLSARIIIIIFLFVLTVSTHVKSSEGKDEIKEKGLGYIGKWCISSEQ